MNFINVIMSMEKLFFCLYKEIGIKGLIDYIKALHFNGGFFIMYTTKSSCFRGKGKVDGKGMESTYKTWKNSSNKFQEGIACDVAS